MNEIQRIVYHLRQRPVTQAADELKTALESLYGEIKAAADMETVVCDLMHLADRLHLQWERILKMGTQQYGNERQATEIIADEIGE